MKVKNIIQQIEYTMGRQPEQYMIQLINDALIDMSGKIQKFSRDKKQSLNKNQRWYSLDSDVIDVFRVEILDNNNRYVKIPKLADPHNILKADSDESSINITVNYGRTDTAQQEASDDYQK